MDKQVTLPLRLEALRDYWIAYHKRKIESYNGEGRAATTKRERMYWHGKVQIHEELLAVWQNAVFRNA
jgi:hypothetical protein